MLIITLALFFVNRTGVIFGYLSNEKISGSIENFGNTASIALQDGINYLNDTVNVSQLIINSSGLHGVSEVAIVIFIPTGVGLHCN